MNSSNISDQFFNWLGNFIPFITSANGVNWFVKVLIIAGIILWFYFGLRMFWSVTSRLKGGAFLYLSLFIAGILTGPLGLIIFNIFKPQYTPEELDFIKTEHKFYYQQSATVLDCIKCNAYILKDEAYCTNCGQQNRFKCESCNTLTDYDDNYCHTCGADFHDRYQSILASVTPIRARLQIKSKVEKTTQLEKDLPKRDLEIGKKLYGLGIIFRKLFISFKDNIVKLFDFGGNLKSNFIKQEPNLNVDYASLDLEVHEEISESTSEQSQEKKLSKKSKNHKKKKKKSKKR
jgi:hypothetical protein